MELRLNNKFDADKIKITRIREEPNWYGNAVHFRYNGQTYRASIREDPDSEDESGNRINYAHLQIADKNGTWGADIAKVYYEDKILVDLNDIGKKSLERFVSKYRGSYYSFAQSQKYIRTIPYKFYDKSSFADYLNSVFVKG